MRIRPNVKEEIQEFLNTREHLFSLTRLHTGPIHMIFPHNLMANADQLRNIAHTRGISLDLHFAHKANKSSSLIKVAKKGGLKIDIASEKELQHVLGCGFTGSEISISGPKNEQLILLGIMHGCTFNVDSHQEIHCLQRLTEQLDKKVSLLVRISDPAVEARRILSKRSKFGIAQEQIEQLYKCLQGNPRMRFLGLQIHRDGYDNETRSQHILNLYALLVKAYSYGLAPTIINIGGGFRSGLVADYQEWFSFIEKCSTDLMNGSLEEFWGSDPYGMLLNSKGRIENRDRALSKAYVSDGAKDLDAILSYEVDENHTLAKLLNDASFTLMIESGFYLTKDVGATLLTVQDVKKMADGRSVIIVNGNKYNLSAEKMFDLIADPIHIVGKEKGTSEQTTEGFIMGNLCLEDDLIIKRKVTFEQPVSVGDYLIFANTGQYFMDFEDCRPIMQKTGKKFVCTKETDVWEIWDDEVYNPFMVR